MALCLSHHSCHKSSHTIYLSAKEVIECGPPSIREETFFDIQKNYHLPSLGHITVTGQPELGARLEREYPRRDGQARLVLIIIQSVSPCTSLS